MTDVLEAEGERMTMVRPSGLLATWLVCPRHQQQRKSMLSKSTCDQAFTACSDNAPLVHLKHVPAAYELASAVVHFESDGALSPLRGTRGVWST